MKILEKLTRPISFYAGILVIIIFCFCTFTSFILFPPPFSPLDNWLSDLGNPSYNNIGAFFFNIGCILTGILLFPFSIGFFKWYRDDLWHKILMIITQIIGCTTGFALVMLGIYSEAFAELHVFWANTFFIFNLSFLIFASLSLLMHSDFIKLISLYGIVVVIVNLLFLFFFVTPILEWFTVFTALGYVGLIVYNMYLVMD